MWQTYLADFQNQSKTVKNKYNKTCSVEDVRTSFDASKSKTSENQIQVPVVNNITLEKNGKNDQLLYHASDWTMALTIQDLYGIYTYVTFTNC